MKKVCIVGYGAIGPVHAKSLSNIHNVTLYGICDIDRERADKGAFEHGCKAFYSLKDCLKDEEIDSIHICTPHYLHYEMIESCLAAGKMVVIEKPVTMKKEEFSMLLSKHKGAPVYPIMQNRTNNCITMLKDIVNTNMEIGQLKAIKGLMIWHRDEKYYDSAAWRGTKAYEGGGVLINQAVHTLDLMIYLAGNVKSVKATTSNKSLEGIIEVEDTVDALIKFENGATGIFYATNAYGVNSSVQVEMEFENGTFKYVDGELYHNKKLLCRDDNKFLGKSYWGCGHERVFYDLYVNQKAFTVKDIMNTMQTMFALYESSEANSTEISLY